MRKNNKTGSIKFQFQTTLQNYSNQNSVSLAKKKKRETEREREHWNRIQSPEKKLLLQSTNLWQGHQGQTMTQD